MMPLFEVLTPNGWISTHQGSYVVTGHQKLMTNGLRFRSHKGFPWEGMDKWSLIFGVTIWKICKWQNGRNSQGKNCAGTVVMEILSFVNDTVKSKTLKSSVMPDRHESMVAWQKPVGSWLKINTGEAYKGSPGVAGRSDKGC
ncbi:hypothetical protein H0E87_021927 [Populus deltoides]|uniref:Uncharacterized protein n=1 Tax=Populus deltoides TaxID=3696 RepID=A0A8T2XHD0_POPDE|nr:hypothetical protein H0E87_021927 [Populus deltoides]